MFISLL